MAKPRSRLTKIWRKYQYKHTTGAILAVAGFVTLVDSALVVSAFKFLEGLDYIGAFIAGALSASFFTALPALALFLDLIQKLDPLPLAMMVGLGNAIGDMLLLMFFEEQVFSELKPLFKRLKILKRFKRFHRTSYTLSLLAGVTFIVTPLPDEIGLGILGISHFPKPIILAICWGLNTLGASVVILTAHSLMG